MKRFKLLFLSCFFLPSFLVFFCQFPGFSIDKETLWSKLTFADNVESTEDAFKTAFNNLGLAEEIIFIPDTTVDNSVARYNSFVVLKHASRVGKISKERFFDIAFRFLARIDSLIHPSRMTSEKRRLKSEIARYSTPANFSLSDFVSNGIAILDAMKNNGLITDSKFFSLLKDKFVFVLKEIHRANDGEIEKIKSLLDGAINEIYFETGKGIATDAAEVLILYCTKLSEKQ